MTTIKAPRIQGLALVLALTALWSCGPDTAVPHAASPAPSAIPSASPGSAQAPLPGVEGFGAVATGGAGGSVCTVTNPASSGAGTFSDCARRGNVIVQFSSPGPFLVDGENTYLHSNTTIDGCANGQNGVTLDQPADIHRGIIVEGPASNFIFRCLRFQGSGKVPGKLTEFDLLALDGESGLVSKVLVDRCTFISTTNKATDLVQSVSDVTIQRSLYYGNGYNMLIKYKTRSRISMHHNVFTGNCERNPQIKGDMNGIDYVSNVVGPQADPPIVDGENGRAFTDCYGVLFWADNSSGDSPGNPRGNVVSNAFFGKDPLTFTVEPGASVDGVYLKDNEYLGPPWPGYVWPGGSPAATPYPIPAAAAITVTPVSGLKATLGTVGSPNRTALDQARLDTAAAGLP